MTRIVNTYTSSNGTEYSLREFDSSQLYHPNTVREVKRSNAEYYDVINADKKRAKLEEAQAKIPRQLSDDEKFTLAVERKKQQDAEKKALVDREQQKLDAHTEYLNSTPEVAQVCSTNFLVFQNEVHQWRLKGYSIMVDTLEALPPSLFNCQLSASVASKKK